MVTPRFQLIPPGAVSSRGAEAVELARGAGLVLDEHQQLVLHGGLGLHADGSYTAFEVVDIEARQNGKTAILKARVMLGLKDGEQIGYSSHRVDSSQEAFRDLVGLVEASPELSPLLDRVVYSNGKESIWLSNGGRVVFGTRSSRTGRGFSLDLLLLDEAHIVSEQAHDALIPSTSARKRPPQVWYAGTAVDEMTNEHGVVLARLRERGIAGEATNLAYFEWSIGFYDEEGVELRPEQVTPEMLDDEELWLQANPTLGERIRLEHVRSEREAMGHRGFCVERCSIGAWPDTSGAASSPITAEEWAELEDRKSTRVGEIVLAFDVAPDRHAALVVCGRRGVDDLLHVELLQSASGTAWLRERLEYFDSAYAVHEIVCDEYGGNRAMRAVLEEAGLNVRGLTAGEHAGACGKFLDLVAERAFRHIGQPELLAALRGGKSKPLGDAWVWSRKASTGDSALVVAMTLALAVGSEIPVGTDGLFVY